MLIRAYAYTHAHAFLQEPHLFAERDRHSGSAEGVSIMSLYSIRVYYFAVTVAVVASFFLLPLLISMIISTDRSCVGVLVVLSLIFPLLMIDIKVFC